jgi:deoxyribonucleoside regulator
LSIISHLNIIAKAEGIMSDLSDDRRELLAQAANLYFEDGLNQGDIAEQLGVSRASVSRLLAEARQLGVVEIRINFPLTRNSELESALAEQFGLSMVYVLSTKSILPEHILGRLGRLASQHLQARLQPGMIVALSWGTAVFETVQAMRRRAVDGLQVVQVIGAAGSGNPRIDGPDLARELAERLNGEYHYLHAPLLVENSFVRDTLLNDPRMQRTLELARKANVALVGIGSTQPEISPLVRAGYLTSAQGEELARLGAVGDFCGYHIDQQGELVDSPVNQRVVGITLSDLREIPLVIGVAGGAIKAPTMLGVLRGELIDVLVTDDQAAQEVLRLHKA